MEFSFSSVAAELSVSQEQFSAMKFGVESCVEGKWALYIDAV
jgi:hypothetical protein